MATKARMVEKVASIRIYHNGDMVFTSSPDGRILVAVEDVVLSDTAKRAVDVMKLCAVSGEPGIDVVVPGFGSVYKFQTIGATEFVFNKCTLRDDPATMCKVFDVEITEVPDGNN